MKYTVLLTLAGLTACHQASPPATGAASPPPPARAPAPVAPTAVVNTAEARRLLRQPGTQVLDVRTPEEYAAGHLPGAQNIDVSGAQFGAQVRQLDTTRRYVVYCHSGRRSARAAEVMYHHGFRHVVNGGAYDSLRR